MHLLNCSHSGSSTHTLSLFSTSGAHLNTVLLPATTSSLFQQSRSTPLSATAFHPHKMLLAAASVGGGGINLYGCSGSREGGEGDTKG